MSTPVANPYKPQNKKQRQCEEIPQNESTARGYNRGVALYNDFALHNDFVQFKDLSISYLDEILVEEEGKTRCYSLFARFANYLLRDDIGPNEKGFMPGVCYQYFSNFKMALAEKLPGYDKLKKNHDDWYVDLYRRVKDRAVVRNMEKGEPISDRSDSIWRYMLMSLCLHLVKLNTSEVRMII